MPRVVRLAEGDTVPPAVRVKRKQLALIVIVFVGTKTDGSSAWRAGACSLRDRDETRVDKCKNLKKFGNVGCLVHIFFS